MEKDAEAIFIIGCHGKGTARLDRFQGHMDTGQGELWAFLRAALGLEERASGPSGEGQERSGWGRGRQQRGGSGPRREARNRFHQA